MGAYGSPDTGNLYSGNDNVKTKRKKSRRLWIIPVVLYILVLLFSDEKLEFIVSSFGLFSAGTFLVTFIKIIIDLIRKKSVNKDVIILLIAILVFIICTVLTPTI